MTTHTKKTKDEEEKNIMTWNSFFYFFWPGMMTLLDDYEGDSWLVVWFQLDASLTDCSQLVLGVDLNQHLSHLCSQASRYFAQLSLHTKARNQCRRKPEAHVGTVPHWRRPCTWWSGGACSPRCSCRTSPGAPSPKKTFASAVDAELKKSSP